jgi:uncharacterized protein YgiM (DUF1202 family)
MHGSSRKLIVFLVVVLAAILLYWKFHSNHKVVDEAYAAEPTVNVWSTTAQVRQLAAEIHWGEKVEVLGHSDAFTKVRTIKGVTGWVDGRRIVDGTTWQKEEQLVEKARPMPLQATGRTKVTTNLRLEPGRNTQRIYQLPGSVHVSILARATADSTPPPPQGSSRSAKDKAAADKAAADKAAADKAAANKSATDKTADKPEPPKREDWLFITVTPTSSSSAPSTGSADSPQANQALLVTGNDPSQQPAGAPGAAVPQLAGWVLARFIELSLPSTLRDYATSSGMHPVAWFVLNRIQTSQGERSQYLVAGTMGGEGQSCDFSLIRVYTWGGGRSRYETAYIESDLCGYFPITVDKPTGKGDPVFHFTALTEKEPRQERTYVMHQTSVRRLREGETIAKTPAVKPKHR